jgi:glycosyltransferase involved in cell wall biosynthesis
MRIAHLPSSYLPDSLGGTEIYVHHLAEELSRQGHDSVVVVHGGRMDAEQPSSRYHVQRLPALPPCTRAELYGRLQREQPPRFAEFLDEWRPDVVHFHALTLGAGLAHARLAHQRGISYVATYHTPTFSCARGTLMYDGQSACDGRIDPTRCAGCVLQGQGWPRPLARLLARSPLSHAKLPDGPWVPRVALKSLVNTARSHWQEFMDGAATIVACAAWCRDVLVRNGVDPAKIAVHRQALPGPTRTRTLRLPLAKDRPLRLGFFGRFCWVKGPDLLLDAAARLRRQGFDVTCELAGPIPDNERRWADRLLARHAAYATYNRTLAGEALRAWLRSLDLVVIPSRCLETGPLTLLEAWDEGVPVVGVDLGGTAEFLGENGLADFRFSPQDSHALAACIRGVAQWRRPGPNVQIRGMQELASATVELYESLFVGSSA